MSSRDRRAFTLVELLVVIAIIGTLVALLLPAVNKVRENSRRTTCLNNMKNLALAVQNFENTKGRYPGIREFIPYMPNPTAANPGANKWATWVVAIMPMIEQQQMYDRWNDATLAPNAATLTNRIELLICPSKPNVNMSLPEPYNAYIANMGFRMRASDPAPMNNLGNLPAYKETQIAANGVFLDRCVFPTLRVNLSDVRDGASNTMTLSESLYSNNWTDASQGFYPELYNGMAWLYCNEQGVQVDPHVKTNTVLAPQLVSLRAKINGNPGVMFPPGTLLGPPIANPEELARPSAKHSGVVVCGFADGHVTPIRETIAYHVYQDLLTPEARRSYMPYRTHVPSPNEIQ